jgi:myo-inositol 2-dehydrogenase/D-chiro-inositol 1-dehydrogenase
MAEPMRIGIIGTQWGRMHIGAFRGAGAEVFGICGRDPDKTSRIAREEHVPFATTDVRAMCEHVDAIVVAGPDGLHYEHTKIALECGRHVLSEKPLTRLASHAEELTALLAKQPRLVGAVSFPYRLLPPVGGLRAWLSERKHARWISATIRNSFSAVEGMNDDAPNMGFSGDFGGMSHIVDTALWLGRSRAVWVEAEMRGCPVHSGTIIVGMESGGVATLTHVSAREPGIHGQWAVTGDNYDARFSGGYRPELGGWRIGPSELFEGTWRETGPLVEPRQGGREPWAQAHVAMAAQFLAAIEGDAAPVLPRFEMGAHVQHILLAALKSARENKRILLAKAAPKTLQE